MIERNTGHVVTIASIMGHIGNSSLTDYCASKFAVVGFDESLRMEFKSKGYSNLKLNKVILLDIKTTCINPYFISTGMFEGS
jgi:all-trans-retinol dehydrogenase (NAD+)